MSSRSCCRAIVATKVALSTAIACFVVPIVADAAGRFTAASGFVTGRQALEDQPFFPGIADLNRDGHLDLVTAAGCDSVQIRIGRGDGGFEAPLFFAPGGGPFLAIADFDADGALDIASTGYSTVGVLFGDGTGRSWTPVQVSPLFAFGTAAGDFDSDGRMDFVALTALSPWITVSTFLSRPGRSFMTVAAVQDSVEGGNNFRALRTADFDRDGILDLAVVTHVGSVFVLRGRGDGTFVTKRVTMLGLPRPLQIEVSDVTGDGVPDIVAAHGYALVLYRGRGNASFDSGVLLSPESSGIRAVSTGDFDGDGVVDLVSCADTGPLLTQRGLGSGVFGPAEPGPTRFGAFPIVLGDLDGDERLDVIARSTEAEGLFIALGDGRGRFGDSVVDLPASSVPNAVAAADLDGDGSPELLAATVGTPGIPELCIWSESGRQFAPLSRLPLSGPALAIATGDLDENGSIDVLVTVFPARVAVFSNSGSGTLNGPVEYPLPATPLSIELADATGDGHLDIVHTALQSIRVLPGVGDGSFGTPIESALGLPVSWFSVGDLTGDGRPDVAVTVSPQGRAVARNDGQGRFTLGPVSWNQPTASFAIGDVSGDGRNDLVIVPHTPQACDDRSAVALLVQVQRPDGTLGAPMPTSGDFTSQLPRLIDLDADGHLDVVTQSPGGFVLYRGDGTGRFLFEQGWLLSRDQGPPAFADFDGDGRLDAAQGGSTLSGARFVSVGFGRDVEAPTIEAFEPPNGTLTIGDLVPIRWSVGDADSRDVELFVSHHGSDGPFRAIARRLPAAGTFQWTVAGPISDSVSFKITAHDSTGNVTLAKSAALGRAVGLASRATTLSPSARVALQAFGPSPTHRSLAVRCELPRAGRVVLDLHDLAGRRIARLHDSEHSSGAFVTELDLRSSLGVGPGVYALRLHAPGGNDVARLVYLPH